MRKVFGAFRLALTIAIILLAFLAVLLTSLVPIRVRGIPLTYLSVHYATRLLCFAFRIHVECTDKALLQSHRGLVFPNHQSALDVIVLYATAPMRFLAAEDNQHRFLVGRITRSVGTVFVQRDSPRSRLEARTKVLAALKENPFPPIVLFPEGRLGPGDTLFPFRHGAFGIAIEGNTPYLPVAIEYNPLEVVLWRAAADKEGMWSSVWRMVQYTGSIEVRLIPLGVVQPKQDDSAKELASIAREDVARTLGLPLYDTV